MFAPLLLIAVILVATTKLGPYVGKNQKRFMVKVDSRNVRSFAKWLTKGCIVAGQASQIASELFHGVWHAIHINVFFPFRKSSVLTQLVPIKLSGYETIIGERIKSIRLEELSVLRHAVKWIIWSASLGYFASAFSGPACIGVYL
jgi:hypothetical protein